MDNRGGRWYDTDGGYLKGMNNANGTSMDAWKNFSDTGYEKAEETYLYVSKSVDFYQEYETNDNGEEYEMIFVMNNETDYGQTILSLRSGALSEQILYRTRGRGT